MSGNGSWLHRKMSNVQIAVEVAKESSIHKWLTHSDMGFQTHQNHQKRQQKEAGKQNLCMAG